MTTFISQFTYLRTNIGVNANIIQPTIVINQCKGSHRQSV